MTYVEETDSIEKYREKQRKIHIHNSISLVICTMINLAAFLFLAINTGFQSEANMLILPPLCINVILVGSGFIISLIGLNRIKPKKDEIHLEEQLKINQLMKTSKILRIIGIVILIIMVGLSLFWFVWDNI